MSDLPPGPCYCLRCNAKLSVHPLGDIGPSKCLRCGLPFVPEKPETDATRPRPFQWNLWVPGLLIAIVAGVLAYARSVDNSVLGYTAFLGIPFAVGCILGFAVRSPRYWVIPIVSLFAITCIVLAVISAHLNGLFCGAILGALFLGPVFLGALVGLGVQRLARVASWDRRQYFFLALFVGFPFGAGEVESWLPFDHPIVEVSTSATFDAPVRATWDAIRFYEQVEHEPPMLLKLALPLPLRAEGSKAAVGDVERCIYVRGSMVKTITRLEEGRFLAFDVSEQHLHFEHDVELVDGSFLIQPLDARQTRVVLTTRYRRLLRPAWLWQPMEREIIHTLHEHIMEGMRRSAERPR
jgi:hypothetical protein